MKSVSSAGCACSAAGSFTAGGTLSVSREAGHVRRVSNALQLIFFQREMFVGAKIVDPELFCPSLFGGGFAVEQEDVGLHTLGVEDAGR